MRIRRLRVANVEGIGEREVTFVASGVTIVQGPNEIGKSALLRAIDAIFDYPSDSQARRVRALLPAGRDVGAEVEIEVACGPYEFTYFKRFRRRPETWLRVTQPRAEQLSGRQAHDRVREILAETIDIDLWEALRVQQGTGIGQAELSESRSLMTALDHAAGTVPAGDREMTLYERVHDEYRRYYTETGREGQDLRQASAKVDAAKAEHQHLGEKLSQLEDAIERADWLDRELKHLGGRVLEADQKAAEREADLRKLEQVEAEVDRLHLALDAADGQAKAAKESQAARAGLLAQVSDLRGELNGLMVAETGLHSELDEKETEAKRRNRVVEVAARRLDEGERLLALRRQDEEFRHEELDLQMMSERLQRVVVIRKAVLDAKAVLQRTKIKRSGLDRIEHQVLELHAAKAALAAGSPTLHLRSYIDLNVLLDGTPETVRPGVELERTIADQLQLDLPDQFQLSIRAGTSLESLAHAVSSAEAQLSKLFRGYGVASQDEAEQRVREREEAERTLAEAEPRLLENLRDITFEQLAEKIEDLTRRTLRYLDERQDAGGSVIGADLDSCRTLRLVAEREAAAVRSEHQERDQEAGAAGDVLQDVRNRYQGVVAQIQMLREHITRRESELTDVRTVAADEDLEAAGLVANDRFVEARQRWQSAIDEFKIAQPETVRTLASNARATFENLTQQQGELERERLQLKTKLELWGEEGLGESVEAARARVTQLDREQARLSARAAAALHLFEVMRASRETAKLRREGPLRERINEFGIILFGQGFAVELDDRLRISRRILDGLALDFEQLSSGAQEQLAVIARLACAMLVADDGGVPLMLDDALGYSDDQRLERMGAILSLAGERTQVIVLTCQPARYSHVGHATTVWLS